jgi:uncharacterized protein (TIGR03435 family)
VWWIKNRLLEEREQACDEAVLQSGNVADVYAESILNVCKFCIESPLACVAGVAGSDLKRRIVRIMTEKVARNLNLGRKLLLVLAATVAIAVPVVFGLVHIKQASAQILTGSQAQDIAGTWQGTLHSGLDLRGVFQIFKAEGGGYNGVFYAIDQSETSVPVTRITLDGANVKISIADIAAVFEGKLNSDGMSISGTLNQLSFTHPLILNRATPETAWEIPKSQPMAVDADPSFTTAIIKPGKPDHPDKGFAVQPGRLAAANITLNDLISIAYDIHPKQLIGAPSWVATDKFDITAQFSGKGEPSSSQLQSLVRKLLAERFKLSFHRDKKELLVYALSTARTGPKLTRSVANSNQSPGLYLQDLGKLKANNATMHDFVDAMQYSVLDRPVLDRTGIAGRYAFTLNWTPDESQFRRWRALIPHSTGTKALPPLSVAIQEQLGLKFDSAMASAEILVIDHVEKPANGD